jgi:hypothetical protein
MSEFTKFLTAALFAVLSASSVSAQRISYGEAMDQLIGACGADVDKYCKDVRLGGARIQICLSENSSKISPQCKATFATVFESLTKRAQAQAAAPVLCKAEADRLCENFREGRGRILRCLIRPEVAKNVAKQCNQAITDAGWR